MIIFLRYRLFALFLGVLLGTVGASLRRCQGEETSRLAFQWEDETELTLRRTDVYPRIFSPNGDGINDAVYFGINNPAQETLVGKIFDGAGQEVADLRDTAQGPTPDALFWDGRDRAGQRVPAGAYLYIIRGETRVFKGSVVVAQ